MRMLAPLVTFTIFVIAESSSGRQLNSATALTTLPLIETLSTPVNTLIRTIPRLKAGLACFDRIQTFLESPSRKHHNLSLSTMSSATDRFNLSKGEVDSVNKSSTKNNNLELETLNMGLQRSFNSTMIDIRNASFG